MAIIPRTMKVKLRAELFYKRVVRHVGSPNKNFFGRSLFATHKDCEDTIEDSGTGDAFVTSL